MSTAVSKRSISIIFLFCIVTYLSCVKDKDPKLSTDDDLPGLVEMTPFKIPVNLGYDVPVIPNDNKMYLERVLLGKELFLIKNFQTIMNPAILVINQNSGFL